MPSSLSDYEVQETIGTGSYGVCKKIKRKRDGKTLVWKELDYGSMSDTERQLLVSEVNLLRELRHKHIVRYYDRIIDRGSSKLYIVMEYCEGGDVCSLINKLKKEGKRIEEPIVWKICSQILLALQECHSRSKNGKVVLHRDLKPANVFLDADMNVKLGDFGLARTLNHEHSFAQTYVGTPYYMSPEQMNHMSYNEKSDVWSLGCLLYEMTALKPPFTATGIHELTSRINMGRFARIPFRYSDDLNRLICAVLQVDESRRPTVEDLLEHPMVQGEIEKIQSASGGKPESDSRRQSLPNSAGSSKQTTLHNSDEGYSSKVDSLKKREEALKEREDSLKQKEVFLKQRERELETREKSLLVREKIADERLSRAERLSVHFSKDLAVTPSSASSPATTDSNTASKAPSDGSSSTTEVPSSSMVTTLHESKISVDIPVPRGSILSASGGKHRRLSAPSESELPKKKVSFLHVNINDKENLISHVDLPPGSSQTSVVEKSQLDLPKSPSTPQSSIERQRDFPKFSTAFKGSVDRGLDLPKTYQNVERQLRMAEHSRQLHELHTQTRYSFNRARSSFDLTNYNREMRSKPWIGLR